MFCFHDLKMTKDLLKTDFQRGDFIPHGQLNLLAKMVGRGEAGPAAFVDGTGSYSRSLPSQDVEVFFKPNAVVAPYAVMETTGTEVLGGGMSVALLTRQYQAGDPRKALVINSHWAVKANEFGRGILATQAPVIILGSGSAGASVGPSNASWVLATGHPGFRMIGDGPVANTIFAVREFAPTVCEAILKGAMVVADPTGTVDNVVALSGLDPVANAAAELTVQNTHSWDVDDDATCEIKWNESDNQWEFTQAQC